MKLVDDIYSFDVEEVCKGEGGKSLLTNQQFLIKIRGSNEYLTNEYDENKGITQITVSEHNHDPPEE